MTKTKNTTHPNTFEIVGFAMILINIVIFLYFIYKLNQIESLARETQAQAQEFIQAAQLLK